MRSLAPRDAGHTKLVGEVGKCESEVESCKSGPEGTPGSNSLILQKAHKSAGTQNRTKSLKTIAATREDQVRFAAPSAGVVVGAETTGPFGRPQDVLDGALRSARSDTTP
jgi:hypothetical protein